MKSIIKNTKLSKNNHVIRIDGCAYAIFTGYNEYYQSMISGAVAGRVVRFSQPNIAQWTDEEILDTAKNVGTMIDVDQFIKIIRKGWVVL